MLCGIAWGSDLHIAKMHDQCQACDAIQPQAYTVRQRVLP